jgi:hypothetical protein
MARPRRKGESFLHDISEEETMSRRRTRTTVMALGVAALAACTAQPSRFQLLGTRDDRSRLSGEWLGEFESSSAGRNGSISVRLEPGRDSASGDVYVDVVHAGEQAGYHDQRVYTRIATAAMRIGYVRVRPWTVEGALEPFHDPDCVCLVTTRFRGVVRGDSITGEYVSRGGWRVREGVWRMGRTTTASDHRPEERSAVRAFR